MNVGNLAASDRMNEKSPGSMGRIRVLENVGIVLFIASWFSQPNSFLERHLYSRILPIQGQGRYLCKDADRPNSDAEAGQTESKRATPNSPLTVRFAVFAKVGVSAGIRISETSSINT